MRGPDHVRLDRRERHRAELKAIRLKAIVRKRLADRDRAYAESGCAASVTVVERGGRVIETRGTAPISGSVTFGGRW